MSINELASEIQSLSFEDKTKLYTKCFSFGYLSSPELNSKLVLISLVALSSSKLKENNPNLTTLDFLIKLSGIDPNKKNHYYYFLENLALISDDLSYMVTKFDPCGYKDSKEIINKIKELLQSWLPF